MSKTKTTKTSGDKQRAKFKRRFIKELRAFFAMRARHSNPGWYIGNEEQDFRRYTATEYAMLRDNAKALPGLFRPVKAKVSK